MDKTDLIVIFLRWIHIGAAIVAVGGVVFMRMALLPSMRDSLEPAARDKLRGQVRMRWQRVVHGCVMLLLMTGGANFWLLAGPGKVEPMPYHAIFGFKLMAAVGLFVLAFLLVGRGAGAQKVQQKAGTILVVMMMLGALIVLLSGVLNHVRHQSVPAPPTATKPTAESTPAASDQRPPPAIGIAAAADRG